MPRQLIIDVHERMYEISTVPRFLPGEPTAKGTDLDFTAGKEDPVEFDTSLISEVT